MNTCASLCALVGLSSCVASARAQSEALLATPAVRVVAPVENDSLVKLKGNVSALAAARFDRGAAPASEATGSLRLVLKRSPAQQNALRAYLGSVQDPHSARYHKWLTPASYGASFGISDQDLETVKAWLQSEGFTVGAVPAGRNFVSFSGTFGQVAQAFHTTMHSYLVNGIRHYSNASDPSIPAALAPVVAAISPLNDFRPHPLHVLGRSVKMQRVNNRLQVAPTLNRQAAPLLTGQASDGTPFLAVTAADAATIYNAPNPFNRNFKAGSVTPRTGANVNIGLVGDSDLRIQDYITYRQTFLNDPSPAQPTIVNDGPAPGIVPGDATESLVDTELAAGLAPGANIYYYTSANDLLQSGVYNAALRAVEDNNVAILSVSFGNCEANLGAAGNSLINELWQQAAAQGISVLVSTGDSGVAGCDSSNAATAQGGFAVSGFASTPYDTAVGGTDFDLLALTNNFSNYVANSGAAPYFETALGYIPENPWNDSISNNPPASGTSNTPQQYQDGNGNATTTVAAGGGGVSSAAICNGATDANGNCVATPTGYPQPPFQSGISLGGGARTIPDVSLFSADGAHQAGWVFCSDPVADTTLTKTDCLAGEGGPFPVGIVGGTSTSAPAFAGILAQVIEALGPGARLGLANNALYNLAAGNASAIFHDTTAGNISVPCQSGSPNCGANGFLSGYDAGAGYDLASGLGSVDITALINGWTAQSFAATSTSLAANGATSPITITHGAAVTLSTTVTPTNASGTVSITGPSGQAAGAVYQNIPLTAGVGSVQVNDLPGGSYSIQAYYPGDVNHSPSTSAAIPVVVSPESSVPNLSLAIGDLSTGNYTSNPSTATYGANGFAYIQPSNPSALNTGGSFDGFASGTATLLNNGSALATQSLNSQGVASFPLYTLTPGTYSFSAAYSGDNSYTASSTTAGLPLTISKGPTTLVLHTAGSPTSAPGTSTVEVDLQTDSAGAAPTGAVTLTVNGNPVQGTATAGLLSDGAIAQFVTFSIPSSMLKGNGDKLQATYPGDNNYVSSNTTPCTYSATGIALLQKTGSQGSRWSLLGLAGSSGALALCSGLWLWLPVRRRALRSLLMALVAVALIGVVGCGSTSNNNSNLNVNAKACAQ